MKNALPNTKVTVKLRRSRYKEEWYLIIESYPVYKRGSTRASRVVESINRTISTPVWDKSSIARQMEVLARLVLPSGILDYFAIVGIEQSSTEFHISLDELESSEMLNAPHFESKGFMDAVSVTDFPIRDHKVILHIRRRSGQICVRARVSACP